MARGPESAVVDDRARVFVLDRGGEDGVLNTLVPGAVRLRLGDGGEGGATIDPWEVEDAGAVPASKVAFVMRLHALLIGEHARGADPLGLRPLERDVLASAVREVYARAAAGAGRPSEGLLRTVLRERASLARGEAGEPGPRAATCAALAGRLTEMCAGGRFGRLLDAPTRVGAAPLVMIDMSLVPDVVAGAVLLTLVEYVSALGARARSDRISLLVDVVERQQTRAGAGLPPVFPHGSLLDGLHHGYLRRRVRAGEPSAVAYLHAISDVAHFLHPPTALSDGT